MLEGMRHRLTVSAMPMRALAETTAGCSRLKPVGRGSLLLSDPLRIIDDVDYATMEWIDGFNNRRLHCVLDYVAPKEYEGPSRSNPGAVPAGEHQPRSRHGTRNGSV